MRFVWHEPKRTANLRLHGLDYSDSAEVFGGPTVTFEDDRSGYAEQRFVTLGLFRGCVVSIVHTEGHGTIRLISLRKATRREQAIYFAEVAK